MTEKIYMMKERTRLTPLVGMTLEGLQKVAKEGGMQRFVARQMAEWLYKKRVTSFDEMINISKKNRQWLEENYSIGRHRPVGESVSSDGTVKLLFNCDGKKIESVYIPDKERATLCVSSQAGCRMNCYFCATGRLGFKGNLTSADIINQILSVSPQEEPGIIRQELTNVVFMGMGEPLDNLGPLLDVIEIMTAEWGMAWSPKRITVSTVGKLPELKDLLDKTKVHVAVSLHTSNPSERAQLMPAQKAFPINSVLQVLKPYDFSGQRRLSFEYILWKGVNDDVKHAEALANMLKGLECRVNLIRFHAIPGVDLKPASEERMLMFRNMLNERGITATIRASRGEDIEAACGMLAAKNTGPKTT